MASNPARHTGLRWLMPLACAGLLVASEQLIGHLDNPRVLPKGSVAPYTLRASADAVFDLRQSYAEEEKTARRSYIPIYNKDNQVLYDTREQIVVAAKLEPAAHWIWSRTPAAEGDADDPRGPEAGPGTARDANDAGAATTPDAASRADGAPASAAPELSDDPPPALDAALSDAAADELLDTRLRELEALIRACIRLIEPYYKAGVIADHEFPSRKDSIRIFTVPSDTSDAPEDSQRHVLRRVSKLHRFSRVRRAVEQSAAQIFFKTPPTLREQVVDYIFRRLPPNLTYAKENKRVIDISDVTGVKVVLIRSGDILARRGQVIDSRAYYGLSAAATAAAQVSATQRTLANFALLSALLLFFVVLSEEVAPELMAGTKPHLLLYFGALALTSGGALALAYYPVQATLLPVAAVALIAGVGFGRVPAILYGVTLPVALHLTGIFDGGATLVTTAGGLSAAMLVRRRRRSGALTAGIIVGLVQALVMEAARAVDGRPQTYAELWAAAQAFGGGVLSGLAAAVALPFVQRWLGQSSRGKLRVLGDFDHPLVRRLRERAPDVFAYTVRVVNLADRAANALDADRLLTRCGALLHDIGRIERTEHGTDATPLERARAEIDHVARGLSKALEQRIPGEVRRLIAEHHGTLELSGLLQQARDARADDSDSSALDAAAFCYAGPKPSTLESAALMIASAVDDTRRASDAPLAPSELVERVLGKLVLERQFDECGLTQGDLRRVQRELVNYLEATEG